VTILKAESVQKLVNRQKLNLLSPLLQEVNELTKGRRLIRPLLSQEPLHLVLRDKPFALWLDPFNLSFFELPSNIAI
jgi:hypothetical protein